MARRSKRPVYRAPKTETAALSVALKKIATQLHSQAADRFLTQLARQATEEDLAAESKRLSSAQAKAASKSALKPAEASGVGVAAFQVRAFGAAAKARGFDLRSMITPKEDRLDAKRKSPNQLGASIERQFGVNLNGARYRRILKDHARDIAKSIEGLSSRQVERVARATSTAIRMGKTQKELTSDLAEILSMTQRDARRIAINSTFTLNARMSEEIAADAGVDSFVWVTMNDGAVRPSHMSCHEKIFTYEKGSDEGFIPGEEPGCRCVPEPVIADD
jgi:SPP1 gp7 family putative phage head morphogenesis protein